MRRSFGHLPAVLAVLALATACASDATTAQVVATAPATPVANAGSAASTAPSTAPAGRSATTPPTTAGRATTTVGGPTGGGSGGGSRGTVRWHSCPDTKGFQCATLTVPLDHANPNGPMINLALNRRPANDLSKRIGSLVVNPGGPGGSGLRARAGRQPAGEAPDGAARPLRSRRLRPAWRRRVRGNRLHDRRPEGRAGRPRRPTRHPRRDRRAGPVPSRRRCRLPGQR